MLQTVLDAKPAGETLTARDTTLAAYRFMLRARVLDDKFAALYRAGKIHGGVFLGRGQEALSAAVGISLKKTDVFAPLIRDAAGRLAFGETILDAVRTYLGSSQGPMRGRDGNVHRGKPLEGYFPMISHLGAMISVVNGALFARRMKGISGTVGATCLGDGATSTGAFHEALNQAAVEKLPLVMVLADNQYAYSTPTSRQFVCDDLADKAIGYGVESSSVDGTDLAACLKTVGNAVAKARAGEGPQLVVAKLLRLCGHGEHDADGDILSAKQSYIDPKLKNSPLGRDCLKVAEEFLLREKWTDAATLATWRSEIVIEIEEAVAQVRREPAPDPYDEKWLAISSAHLSEMHEE
ncbi:MAG TPA: thiamine pyrophosphate-dependent dehydrogenase E1 component subunit alpha [Verrucomicrobiae bacterium]|jgi:pyruvate dehydrogenase E1 component alpha subunit/2-oxoisovalerate dehydrogenase E1 component alpha subunit|nr:thiamine pyrophosphate-dependent dehydrogenase E1 component subunit alpha [Verrucomicrobiae bacterium]